MVNPSALRRHEFREEYARLQGHFPGGEPRIVESEYAGHAIELARAAATDADCVVAVGGDGTLNEVLNGCLQAASQDPQMTVPAIAVLACGTANDFIKSTPLTGRLEHLLALLAAGRYRTVDVGRVRYRDSQGASAERYFINEASIGIGAEVVSRVNRGRRRLGANLTFLRAIVLAFRRFRAITLRLRWDKAAPRNQALLALVAGNGRYFGSGLCIAPDAKLDDGRLSCTLVGDVGVRTFVSKLPQLKRGARIDHPRVLYREAHSIEVTGGKAPVEADGEFLGYTPASIDILSAKVRLVM